MPNAVTVHVKLTAWHLKLLINTTKCYLSKFTIKENPKTNCSITSENVEKNVLHNPRQKNLKSLADKLDQAQTQCDTIMFARLQFQVHWTLDRRIAVNSSG
jgi:hypothetical protein